jgi:hypothetical protein
MGGKADEAAPTIMQPLSLASLSRQCRSMALSDVVNISLVAPTLPAAWAQNTARFTLAAPPPSGASIELECGSRHRAAAVEATASAAPNVSNTWRRRLLEAAGIKQPLSLIWREALLLGSGTAATSSTVPVPGAVLQFLPLIDLQFGVDLSRNLMLNFNSAHLQVAPPRSVACT